jgi:hypothetical protein
MYLIRLLRFLILNDKVIDYLFPKDYCEGKNYYTNGNKLVSSVLNIANKGIFLQIFL